MPRLIAVMGPTAIGKSAVAERLAETLEAQLVSADAFQLYRGLDIGTNKPADRTRYEGLDWLEPHETFGVGAYIRRLLPMLQDWHDAGRDVVIVGGTGLYIRALMDEWQDLQGAPDPDLRHELSARLAAEGVETLAQELRYRAPEIARRIDLRNGARVRRALERVLGAPQAEAWSLPPFKRHKFGLKSDVAILNQHIETRVEHMVRAGWIEEVRSLISQDIDEKCPAFRAIGYSPLARFVRGEVERASALDQIVTETRQYAKRQRTWLRSESGLQWVESPVGGTRSVEDAVHELLDLLKMPKRKNELN